MHKLTHSWLKVWNCTYLSDLELPVLAWSERFPLWRVEELVAVDVVQELAFERYVHPDREEGGVMGELGVILFVTCMFSLRS